MKYIFGLLLLLVSSVCSAATYNLNLAWDAPTAGGNVDGYQLWYKQTGGSYSFANMVDVPTGLTGQVTIDKYTNYTVKCLAYNDGVFTSDKSYVLKFNENGASADTINIYDVSEYGSHDGLDNASVLTDSGKSWEADSLIGDIIWNTIDNSYCTITDNDATTITCTLSGGTDNDWDLGDEYDILASPDELHISTSLLPDAITVTESVSNNDTFTTYDSLSTDEFEGGVFVLDASETLTTEEDAEGVHIAFSFVNYDFSVDPRLTQFLDNDPDRDEISIGTATSAYADQITSIYVIIDGSVSNDGTYIADTITKDLITLNAAEDLTDEGFIELMDDIGSEVTMTYRLVSDPSNEVEFEYLLTWDEYLRAYVKPGNAKVITGGNAGVK